jgi:hypothetical protein
MSIDSKIIQEIKRYNSINNYIFEQDAAAVDPLAAPADPTAADPLAAPADPTAGAAADPTLGATATPTPEVIDTATDTEVEKIGDDGASEESSEGEELDITDLVNSQKKVESKQEEYFDMMFKQIEDMQSKLNSMDQVFEKLNSMEEKIEKYRPKTPQEKLELRSLDSGPFQQKLSDFFVDKQEEMEKSGKNEYVLTTDDVEDFSPKQIEDTFNTYDEENLKNLR